MIQSQKATLVQNLEVLCVKILNSMALASGFDFRMAGSVRWLLGWLAVRRRFRELLAGCRFEGVDSWSASIPLLERRVGVRPTRHCRGPDSLPLLLERDDAKWTATFR
ncbi:hypothetical protein PINS_up021064 [Pythium insidiosum]|nr:hypothetical protein PINS_up011632 [Pythium insidiosum]GLE09423.1 hypothetical protein PINS_up021064 [Pythium insidiosum]